jgi:calcineurin-like phosphoesterase family protein
MENHFVDQYNCIVKKKDVVYFIGDFYWGNNINELKRITQRFNGEKHLILGNHDEMNPFDYVKAGFISVHTSLELQAMGNIDGDSICFNFILHHDPCAAIIEPRMTWLCGHIHTLAKEINNVLNVGVDVWGYVPVSLKMIDDFYYRKVGL